MIQEADMRAALIEILEDDDHYFTADWTPELAVESAADALLKYIQEVVAPQLRAEGWDEGESAGWLNSSAEVEASIPTIINPYRSQA